MFDIFERWLRLGAARLHDAAADLTALDQAIGDGDHGINMDRGFTAIVAQLDAGRPDADGDRALTGTAAKAAGRTLISTVGGAAGPLYGTAFIRGGTSILTADERPPAEQRRGGRHRGRHRRDRRSRQGDDRREDHARRPRAGPRGRLGRRARRVAASKPSCRPWPTRPRPVRPPPCPMLATKGRASYLGERSIGHQDPGATSAALLMRALADAVAAS